MTQPEVTSPENLTKLYWSRAPGRNINKFTGMASGVDLWFCQSCHRLEIPYIACPPFEEQTLTIPASEIQLREWCFNNSAETWKIRNSAMVEKCDGGIIVWDGNKGGTHNVVQQMIEKKKPFTWINPVGEQVWDCY